MIEALQNSPHLWRHLVVKPAIHAHKYQRGHCLVISGPEFRTGASRLAAIAAMNSGAGAVTLAGTETALRIHAAHLTAIMLQPITGPEDLAVWIADRHPSAAVIGPAAGIGRPTLDLLAVLQEAAIPMVIDADALSSLAARPEFMTGGISSASPVVLTPHSGEFRRLFPDLDQDALFRAAPQIFKQSKLEQARAAARLARCVVVYKGHETIIADEDGRAAINTNAGPELAVAGSGDVLAGMIASHMAMGMPAFEAAASAVWLHGDMGARLGFALTAERLAASLEPIFARADLQRPSTL